MKQTVVIVVLDSVGIGALPDAELYGDVGANTLGNVARAVGGLELPFMRKLGLFNIGPIAGMAPLSVQEIQGAYGKMMTASPGKDTITGHWELAGLYVQEPLRTFPQGFPPELIADVEKAIGRQIMGNVKASGTEIINRLGAEHIRTGAPIVYTSVDSVFQIAAHEQVIPPGQLYEMCQKVRALLTGDYLMGRVIARPFVGETDFTRTAGRRDFSLSPPGKTVLDAAAAEGYAVTAVGKVNDIFAGRGITRSIKTGSNDETAAAVLDALPRHDSGIIFANLVDFDMVYGHRNDAHGYGRALEAADTFVGQLIDCACDNTLILITADHGCDPTHPGTDHTREYVPLLVTAHAWSGCGVNLGVRRKLADVAATCAEVLALDYQGAGQSFAAVIAQHWA